MRRVILLLTAVQLVTSACSGEAPPVDQGFSAPVTAGPAPPITTAAPALKTTTTVPVTTTAAPPATTMPPVVTTTMAPLEFDFTPEDALPELTLVDAGAEPRSVRMYDLTEGDTAVAKLRFGFGIKQIVDGVITADAAVDVEAELFAEVVDERSDGFVVASRFGAYTVVTSDPALQAIVAGQYEALAGASIASLMSPRGEVLATHVPEPLADLAELTSALAGTSIVLPSEPIGIGAEWKLVTEVVSVGIVFIQTSTIRVVDIDGSRLVIEMDIDQELGPDGLAIPGIDPSDVEIIYETVGSGSATWDLVRPVPVSAASEVVQDLFVQVSLPDEQGTLNQSLTLTIDLSS